MTKLKSKNKVIKIAASSALVASSFASVVAPISAAPFSDIEKSPHKESIEQLLQRNIIKGYEDGTFKPNKSITRGQAAKIIASVLNLDLANIKNPNFKDISENHQYYAYIAALANKGIITGYEDGTFKQNQTITRGQMAKILAIGFNLTSDGKHPFTDVSKNSPYAQYISALYKNEITTGTTETTFSPRNTVTRGQLASFVIRAEKKLSATKTISGTITAVTKESIAIDGENYSFVNNSILNDDTTRAALLNAKITFNSNNTNIASIKNLELSNNAKSFNGQNILIDQLVIPNKLTSLTAVNAKEVIIKSKAAVAALKFVATEENNILTITNSSISELISSSTLNIVNDRSVIDVINGLQASKITLSGAFNTLKVGTNSTINGEATIENLIGPDIENANIKLSKKIIIGSIQKGSQKLTLKEALKSYGYEQTETTNNPGSGSSNSGGSSSNGGSGSNNSGGSSSNGGSGSNNSGGSSSNGGSDKEDTGKLPTGTEEIANNTTVDYDDKTITINGIKYDVTEEQLETVATYANNLEDIILSVDENHNTIIQSVTLTVQESIDGAKLGEIEQVIIQGAVENITNISSDNLKITTTAAKLNFENVTAKSINATGSFNEISGGKSDELLLTSTTRNVVINNVESKNIVVKEAAIKPLAFRGLVASLTPIAIAAVESSTTTMNITFNEGSYANQNLIVERKDTKIDLRGESFSKISIKSNNVELNSVNDVSALDVNVAGDVTNLRLNANVSEFNLKLEKPIIITGSAKEIELLNVTAPATGTNGWIDLVNVIVKTATLNGGTLLSDNDIYKKYGDNRFTSSFILDSDFGEYTIDTKLEDGETLKYVLLPEDAEVSTTSIPDSAIDYTPSTAIIPYADLPKVVVYKLKDGVLQGYSLPKLPNTSPVTIANPTTVVSTNEVILKTMYSNNTTPAKALQYFLVFTNGELVYSNENLTGSWVKSGNFNTYTLKIDKSVSLKSKRQIYVTNSGVESIGATIKNNPDDFINALKLTAEYSVAGDKQKPEMIYSLLRKISSQYEIPFDSSLLSKYVTAINQDPDAINSIDDVTNLLETVDNNNNYDKDLLLKSEDLYLDGELTKEFSYSKEGIVEASINDFNELVFKPKTVGNTTIKVTDSNNLSTLLNVTVDSNLKVTAEVVKAVTVNSEFLHGANDFRIYESANGKIILPTNLRETFAITTNNVDVNRYTLKLSGTQYSLTDKALPISIEPITNYGLKEITKLTATNIGGWTTVDKKLVLYPINDVAETIYVSDGVNSTAVHIKPDNTLEINIARSTNALSITNDLNLQSAKSIEVSPSDAAVHLYNENGLIRAFAKDESSASYTIKDSANNITLLNVTAKKINGILSVADFNVVKETLPLTDGITVQNVSNPIVRVVEKDLFATATGTTIVTLSNGDQYTVTINYENDQYKMTAEKVQNLIISAEDLQMTNITSIETTNTSVTTQKIENNSKLVVKLDKDTTATLTLTSSNNEKTIVHVTKAGNDYEYTIDKVSLSATDLGLTTLKDVVGSTVDILPARAKVNNSKDAVNIYNFEVGNRTFRVSDDNTSTVVNVSVAANGNGYISVPEVVKHEIKNVPIAPDATIASDAAHLKDGILYATGLGLVNNEATVSVPLVGGANYVVKVKLNPETGLYNFDAQGTITYNKTINKSDLGLDTLSSATAPANTNTAATVVGDDVLISVTKDTETRIQVNGTDGTDLTAKAFIYVNRKDTNTDNPISFTVEKLDNALNLKEYGYNSAPMGLWSHNNVARAQIDSDLTVDFYALGVGTARYEIGPEDKKLLVNIDVTENGARSIDATVVKDALGQEGTIISGDGVRLSTDKKSIYATKADTPTIIRLADHSLVEFTVTIDENGHYKLNKTAEIPATNSATITATDLGLTGTITATGLNTSIATKIEYADTITLSSINEGKTSLVVEDSTGKKAIVNIDVAADKKITVSTPLFKEITGAQLIHTDDNNLVRLVGEKYYATSTGSVELLVTKEDGTKEIQQFVIDKENDQYTISNIETISTAIYTATDLGFAADADLSLESFTDSDKFYVGLMNGEVIAYSKLAGESKGSAKFIVKVTGSTTLRTLVHLNDQGTTLDHKIAVQNVSLTDSVTIDNPELARYKDGKLYLFKEGNTFLTTNSRLQAIDITSDSNGYYNANIRPLEITGTNFKAIAATDSNIIEVTENTVYAKGFGTTQVQDGDKVYTITVTKDSTNKVTITKSEVSSAFIPIGEAGLNEFTDVTLVAGNRDVLSFDRNETGLTIYTDGKTKSQTFAVKVTNGTHNAIINVTVNDAGNISEAKVAKTIIEDIAISANETIENTNARAVWKDNEITIYPLAEGNAAFEFEQGYVNAQITKSTNSFSAQGQILQHTFTDAINTVTNASILNSYNSDKSFYVKGEGTALITAGNKLYSVTVKKEANQYNLQLSQGIAFTTLDLTTAGGTYAEADSDLNGVKAVKDHDEDKLVIYKDGKGVSDIAITTDHGKVLYHTTATETAVSEPTLAAVTLTDGMIGATLLEGTSSRVNNNTVYFLAEGNTVLKATDNRLVNIDVKRHATTNYFTANPTFVGAKLKEVPASLTNYKVVNDEVHALNTSASESFLTAKYYTTVTTSKNGDKYSVTADERLAEKFDFAKFGLSTTIDYENTVQNVAHAKEIDGQLVIYAGTIDDTTTLTVTDNNNKSVKFKVVRSNNGEKFTVTPLVAEESVKFADLGLTNTPAITAVTHDKDIADVIVTESGLTISAKKPGVTSITLTQDDKTVSLINIRVKDTMEVVSTPLTLSATGTILHSTMASEPKSTDKGTLLTATGTMLIKTADNKATITRVTKDETSGFFTVETSNHNLSILSKEVIGVNDIKDIALTGSSVGTFVKADGSELYVYGTNNGVTDILVKDSNKKSSIIVADNASDLTTTVAKQALDATVPTNLTWTSTLVDIRQDVIYATQSGKGVATATYNDTTNVLMNVAVTRKTDQTFDITHNVVAKTFDDNVKIIKNDGLVAINNQVFAQKAGVSTVQVGNNIYTVTVTKNAEGLYDLNVSDPVVQNMFSAAQLGLSKITSYTVKGLTGVDVLKVEKLDDENIAILAKYAGQAEITVTGKLANDSEAKTIIHAAVTETDSGLQLKPTVAKIDLVDAHSIIDTSGTFRGAGNELFALKAGHVVTYVSNYLFNLKAVLIEDILDISALRIEKDMGGPITLKDDETIVEADGNKIMAKDYGITEITVGTDKYRVTVNHDGTMQTELLVADTIDVIDAISSIATISSSQFVTSEEVNKDDVANTEIKFTPTKEGIDIIEVSDGTATIQVEVTVTKEIGTDNLVVSSKLVSKSYDAGVIGFYPTGLDANGVKQYSTTQGVIKIGNDGNITIYPGVTGTKHIAIIGNTKQALFDLTIDSNKNLTFKPVTLNVNYGTFETYPEVIDQSGTAIAKKVEGAIEVAFADTTETVFVLSGDNLYKTLLVQATKNPDNGLYEVTKNIVDDALVYDGEIKNVKGKLRTVTHNDKTVIYADKNTEANVSYVANNQLYKATVDATNYKITANAVLKEAENALTQAKFLEGDNVASLVLNSDTSKYEWHANAEGTGIYQTDSGYVKVNVDVTKVEPITITNLPTLSVESLGSIVSLMTEHEDLYVDGTTIFGTYTGDFVAKIDDILYKGSISSLNPISADILPALQWTNYNEVILDSANIVKIDNTDPANPVFIAKGVGTQNVKFVDSSGLSRTLIVEVDDNYNLTINNELDNIIEYDAVIVNGDSIRLTFSLNLEVSGLNLSKVNAASSSVSGDTIRITKEDDATYLGEFSLELPVLGENKKIVKFKISINDDETHTITASDPNSKIKFDNITNNNITR